MEHQNQMINELPLYVSKLSLDLNIEWLNEFALEEGFEIGCKCYEDFNPDLEQCTFCPVVRAISSKSKETSLIEVAVEDNMDRVYEVTAIPNIVDGQIDSIYEIRKEVTHRVAKKRVPVEMPKKKNDILSSNHLLDIVSNELKDQIDLASKLHGKLSASKLSADQRTHVAGMRISFLKIENILNNIYVIRNLKRDFIKQSKKKASLKGIVTDVFSKYQDKTDFNGNSLDYKYDSEIPLKLIMDKKKVSLIISNLIDYTLTNTNNRYINFMITLREDEQEYIDVSFKIKNVGSILIHDLVKKDVQGYIKGNLALTVIDSLVRHLDGSFNMNPINGYGIDLQVEMRFKKPFAMARLPFLKKFTSLPVKTVENLSYNQKKKILIAEDEPIGRITIEQMLKNEYEVILAKNGKVAVEKYFSEQPDLVIMDIMMPIMNGFDAFDQIQRNCINRVPIIACTAKVIKSEKEYLKSYGFDDYIAKPVSAKSLREIINRHIV